MKYAVVKNNVVENMIMANAEQKEEMEKALNATLEDASIYNLDVGDFWNGETWIHNTDALGIADNVE